MIQEMQTHGHLTGACGGKAQSWEKREIRAPPRAWAKEHLVRTKKRPGRGLMEGSG